jgi:hypothetical protein
MSMNSKQRVLATLRRQTTDRTPIDCWLYQRQFLDRLEADYGTREQFLDEFGIDLFVGFVPYPNQTGRLWDVLELPDFDPGDPRDPKWITHSDWNYDFAGLNVAQAVAQQGSQRAIIAHLWGIVEGTSRVIGIENCWLNLGAQPKIMAAWFDRYADWLCGLVDSVADTGVDIITLSDDWGSNQTMLFSPRMWRNLIAPYATRVVKHAHDRGLLRQPAQRRLHHADHGRSARHRLRLHPPGAGKFGHGPGDDQRKIRRQDHHLRLAGRDRRAAGLRGRRAGGVHHPALSRSTRRAAASSYNTGHFVQPDIPPAAAGARLHRGQAAGAAVPHAVIGLHAQPHGASATAR